MKLLSANSEDSVPLMKSRNPRNWIPLFKRFVDEKVLGKFDARHLKLLNAYLENSSDDEILRELQETSISSPRGPRPPAEDADQNPEDKNVAVPINDFSGVYGDDLPNTKDRDKSSVKKKQISSMKKKISDLQDIKNLACVVEFLSGAIQRQKDAQSLVCRELHFNRKSDQVDGKCNEQKLDFNGLVDNSCSFLLVLYEPEFQVLEYVV